ncbi:hypothetical protein GCK32_001756 [Trichostrongylus colubriformis]|uniref:Uncharacterized protein n=1 Tax=Trichostrongylus colubriformis TaxID=6319 RepID=A0AAN8ESY6_TRICO
MLQKMLRVVLSLAAFILGVCNAQMIRQCTCQEMQPCSKYSSDIFFECGNRCQQHTSSLKVDFNTAKQCFEQIHGAMDAAVNCFSRSFGEACATGAPQQVQKRYLETLKIALANRFNSVLDRSGVRSELMNIFSAGQKFSNCQLKCLDRTAGYACVAKLGCGLALPPDNELVERMLQCSIQSGINTQSMQQLCHCLARTGSYSHLEYVCDKLVIS